MNHNTQLINNSVPSPERGRVESEWIGQWGADRKAAKSSVLQGMVQGSSGDHRLWRASSAIRRIEVTDLSVTRFKVLSQIVCTVVT